ncbi:hypothetical protein FOA52_005054 [Chlamydomonas sp. UWO 241]|nr:hypothetical protein FOA52_005054 [Chlamydomonas sp. UWO 241]
MVVHTRRQARLVDEAAATALAHDVLLSEDLLSQQLWRWLDHDSKAALRGVSKGMRRLVDGAVMVVASPGSGASASDLTSALLRWPHVVDLTLLNVGIINNLAPLSTTTLAGLTSLTVRQAMPKPGVQPRAARDMLPLSSSVGRTLQVLDISGFSGLRSIDAVRSCAQLRCLRMPGCVSVPDLVPLAACSQTLEELWFGGNVRVRSLAPLAACTKLRKLGLRICHDDLYRQVENLQRTCPQLADPASVEIQGLVHDLHPSLLPVMQVRAARDLALRVRDEEGRPEAQDAIATAGAIPALAQLLGRKSPEDVQEAAARALANLSCSHAANKAAIAAVAVPALVQLLGPESREDVQEAAAAALANMAGGNASQVQATIAAAGALPALVRLLHHDSPAGLQSAAASALCNLAASHAPNQVAIAAAGAIPALVQLLGPDYSTDVLQAAAAALANLAGDHDQNKASIAAAGAIPALVPLLGLESDVGLQYAAAGALANLAFRHPGNKAAIASAGAIPHLVHLLRPESSAYVQRIAAGALGNLAANHAQNQATVTAAGAIPALLGLLGFVFPGPLPSPPEVLTDVHSAALGALQTLDLAEWLRMRAAAAVAAHLRVQ